VPSRLVSDIIRSFDSGVVNVAGGEEEVRFASGAAEFTVRVALGADITRLGALESEGIKLPAADFGEGLRQVVRAALADDSRAPQLTGVLMEATEKGLRLTATDSYRLAFRDFEGLSVLEPDSHVLVPAKTLGEVQRLLTGAKDGDDTELVFRHSDLDAVFELASVRITTRLLRGSFPDVQRLVPTSYEYELSVRREDFASALRRVRLLVRDSKDVTTPVRLSFREGIKGEFKGADVMVAFNPTYLLEGVEAVRSETLLLKVTDPGKPALVCGEGENEFRYLLMPVKVS
jgi:DNA polymerase-3 subunit beta